MPERDRFADGSAACDFFDLWLDDRENGVERSLSDYLRRFPGSEDVVAREYLALRAEAEGGAAPPGEGPASPGTAAGGADAGAAAASPYAILRELGRGGQGVVYLAEDARLKRQVALKVLENGVLPLGPSRVARLRREAEALARLDHPGLGVIFDADLDGPRPWIAMRYVAGETLAARIVRARAGSVPPGTRGPLVWGRPETQEDVFSVVRFVEGAARALHAAHEAGVIHRDVKPGNLMIDERGDPVVVDFGVARDEDGLRAVTVSAEVFGTVAYMAPEQIEGARGVDRRVDVYALGVTLHEALTFDLPYAAPTREALLKAILEGSTTDAARKNAAIPKDLAVVIATALERDRDRRYASAQALADELARVMAREPILARPPGLFRRARLFGRRHPVAATAAVAAIVAVGLLVGLGVAFLSRLEREDRSLHALRQAHVARSLADQQPAEALRMAIDAAHQERHPEINGILYEILGACLEERTIRVGPPVNLNLTDGPSMDPSGQFVGLAAVDGAVHVCDVRTGEPFATLKEPETPPGTISARFSPRAALVACASDDGRVTVWDLATRTVSRRFREHAPARVRRGSGRPIAWSADGKRLASGGDDGHVVLYDPTGSETPSRSPVLGAEVTMAAFDPEGARVVAAVDEVPAPGAGIRTAAPLLDARNGAVVRSLGTFPGPVSWVAWDGRGERVLVADDLGGVHVILASDGREEAALPHESRVYWTAFDPTGSRVVTGSADGLVVWDPATRKAVARSTEFGDRSVIRGAFSPDGRLLAVVSWDGTGAVFDAHDWTLKARLRGHHSRPRGVTWTPDGSRVVTSEENSYVHVWYAAGPPFQPVFGRAKERALRVAITPDGARVLVATPDKVSAYDRATQALLWETDPDRLVTGIRLDATGESVIIYGTAGLVRIAGTRSGAAFDLPREGGTVSRAFLFDGGRGAATASDDGRVRLFDTVARTIRARIDAHAGPVVSAAIHEGRGWLATGGADRTVKVFDLATGAPVFASSPWPGPERGLDPLGKVFDVAFDSGARRLLAACDDQNVRVFDCSFGFRERRIGVATPGLLALHPDGRRVLCAARWAGRIGWYDEETCDKVPDSIFNAHSNLITALDLKSDRNLALTASKDGQIGLWSIDPPRNLSMIRTGALVQDAVFSPDGNWVLAALADGTARMWPTDPLPVAERYSPLRP